MSFVTRSSGRQRWVGPKTDWALLCFLRATKSCLQTTNLQNVTCPVSVLVLIQNYYRTKLDYFGTIRTLRRGHRKRGVCIKLAEFDFRICDNFAHPSCDARNKNTSNLRKCGRNLHQICATPPLPTPPLGISEILFGNSVV